MKYLKEKIKYLKDSKFLSRFRLTLMLVIITIFFFNFNPDSLMVRGDVAAVGGEGIVGFIARWVIQVILLPTSVGDGHVGYLPKWTANVPPVVTFTNNKSTFYTGDTTTINWSSGASSCTGTNFSTSGTSSGSLVLAPNSTTTYTVTCNGQATSVTATVKKRPIFIER